VPFALGAFFAGMVLVESQLRHQAARETLPLRDAFAVLCSRVGANIFTAKLPFLVVDEDNTALKVCEEELANGMARAVLGERERATDLDYKVGRPVIDS
jgi:hypothetical protein